MCPSTELVVVECVATQKVVHLCLVFLASTRASQRGQQGFHLKLAPLKPMFLIAEIAAKVAE